MVLYLRGRLPRRAVGLMVGGGLAAALLVACAGTGGGQKVQTLQRIDMPTSTTVYRTTTTDAPSIKALVVHPCGTPPCKVYIAYDPNIYVDQKTDTYALDGQHVSIYCKQDALNVVDPLTGKSSTVWFHINGGMAWLPSVYANIDPGDVPPC